MKRCRSWRREVHSKKTIARLRRFLNYKFPTYVDVNGIYVNGIHFSNFIGTQTNFVAKTLSTTKFDTRIKIKYSPNKSIPHWRKTHKKREYDKREFFMIMKELNLK